MARNWEWLQKKIEWLDNLLAEVGLNVTSIVQGYPEGDLDLRLLGLRGEWTDEDGAALSKLISGTRHHRNARDERTYVGELLLGWVVQDAVAFLLNKTGIKCEATGADAERRLLTGSLITEEPDLHLITSIGQSWWLDVLTDYPTQRGAQSYWQEEHRCDLRDNKFKRLIEKRKGENRVGLIGISVGTKSYFGLEITDDLVNEWETPPKRNPRIFRVETHWPYGGKPATVLKLWSLGVQFRPFAEFPKGLPFFI